MIECGSCFTQAHDWLCLWLAELEIPIYGAWIIRGYEAARIDIFGNDPTAAIPTAANLA